MKAWMKKGSHTDASWIMRYITLEAKMHKYSCKKYDEKKQHKYTAADFCWMFQSFGINSHNATSDRWGILLRTY